MSVGQMTPPAVSSFPPGGNGQQLLLPGISWQFYEAFLAELGERPIHLTYDRGNLEIMTLSLNHERLKRRVGRIVEALTEELNISLVSGGSVTMKREDLDRGLEPDECFYLRNLPYMMGKKELDLRVDPPPDLVIEIDITRSSLSRLSIYAALGIPEVWRFNGESLWVYQLRGDGTYELRQESRNFPFLPLAELTPFLQITADTDETALIRSFRSWVRERILPNYRKTTDGTSNPT